MEYFGLVWKDLLQAIEFDTYECSCCSFSSSLQAIYFDCQCTIVLTHGSGELITHNTQSGPIQKSSGRHLKLRFMFRRHYFVCFLYNQRDLLVKNAIYVLIGCVFLWFRYDLIQEAQCIFNDELDNMLCWLVEGLHVDGEHSSMVDERGKGKHVASSWEDGP